MDPDEDVDYGAAMQAAIFTVVGSSQAQTLLLLDTASSSISSEMIGSVMTKLIGTQHQGSCEEGSDVHDAR